MSRVIFTIKYKPKAKPRKGLGDKAVKQIHKDKRLKRLDRSTAENNAIRHSEG